MPSTPQAARQGSNTPLAVSRYNRVKRWERRASMRLLADMRAQGAQDPIPLTLHNWGRCGGQEPYRTLDRQHRGRQRRIWNTAHRLESAFARGF